ncbi:hypothetical protein AV530_003810 [Patagioenas fasciata monilis]|uniref:Secreted protein n=1 Tax=Patagioenas fasciata monilis TaxID=372326 RepID=A0A1V4KYX5_PATFA|nr:hypothetical protein AV530_003810 [Patagioenas fasciata monilis]
MSFYLFTWVLKLAWARCEAGKSQTRSIVNSSPYVIKCVDPSLKQSHKINSYFLINIWNTSSGFVDSQKTDGMDKCN